MYDFTNTPLPYRTTNRDGNELVITIHAIINNRLICSVTGRGGATFATDYPVINGYLTPPTPSKAERILAAREHFRRDGVLPSLKMTKAYVEGLILAQAVLENQTPAQIRELAASAYPLARLKHVDRHVTA